MRRLIGGVVGLGCALSAASALAAEHHVSPTGQPSGDGSAARPWDLATALAQPAAVAPGDTLWLHQGTYVGNFVSSLRGAAGSPIVVRSFPGEWAQIDGVGGSGADTTLLVNGAWTTFRDFELTNSDPSRWSTTEEEWRPEGLAAFGQNLKFINLILHDTGEVGFWSSATNVEVYGCLIYNHGWDNAGRRGSGHGLYTQNRDGTQTYEDNIIFGGYSFGGHAYTEGGSIKGYAFIGNAYFNAGVLSTISGHKDDLLIGGYTPAGRILLRENMSWAPTNRTRSTQLGYGDTTNEDVTLEDNYFVLGSLNFSHPWTSVTMRGNTFYENVIGTVRAEDHPNNTYLHALPTETRVFVRPNRYEAGRAHVVVYNWADADTAQVDLSQVLSAGDHYEIRNGQNYFSAPVATGVYAGGPVEVTLAGLTPAQPIGSPGGFEPSEYTGKQFNVFVVRRVGGGGDTDGGTNPGTDGGTNPGTDGGTNPGTDGGTNPGTDGGTNPGTDAGTTPRDGGGQAADGGAERSGEDSGCSCRASGAGTASSGLTLAVLTLAGLLVARRRRAR